jgi:hypothetical protein
MAKNTHLAEIDLLSTGVVQKPVQIVHYDWPRIFCWYGTCQEPNSGTPPLTRKLKLTGGRLLREERQHVCIYEVHSFENVHGTIVFALRW